MIAKFTNQCYHESNRFIRPSFAQLSSILNSIGIAIVD